MANWVIWLIQSAAYAIGALISHSEGRSGKLTGFQITAAVMFALLMGAEIVFAKKDGKKRVLKIAYGVVISLAALVIAAILIL